MSPNGSSSSSSRWLCWADDAAALDALAAGRLRGFAAGATFLRALAGV
jgi:hypothetical protein